jgi:hypothetical protein
MTKAVELAFQRSKTPVLVAHPREDTSSIKLKRYMCKDTGIKLFSNFASMPYSPITGNDLTALDKKLISVSSTELRQLKPICICPNCTVVMRSDAVTAKALLNQEINCLFCGTAIIASEMDDEELNEGGGSEDEPEDNGDEGGDDEPLSDEQIDDGDTGEDEPEDNGEGGDDEGEIPEDEGDVSEEDSAELVAEQPTEVTDETPAEIKPEDGEVDTTDEADGDEVPDDALNNDDLANQAEAGKIKVEYNALASMTTAISKETSHLVLASADPLLYYLIADSQPVARLIKEKANQGVQALFTKPESLAMAFFTASAGGLNETITEDFGVEPVVISVPLDEVTQQRINKGIADKETVLETQQAEFQENFQQAMAIAAVGINKGIFKECGHAVKEAFYAELSRLNVRSPEKLIDRVFAKAGEELNVAILNKAFELIKEAPETRNAIAKLVEEAEFQNVVDEDTVISDKFNNDLQDDSVPIVTTAATVPVVEDDNSGGDPKTYKRLFAGIGLNAKRPAQ